MTVVNPKSISGINSITMASGSDNLLTIHTTNTTERVRVNSDGDVIVGSGITVSPDGDVFATGVTTSTTFVGALTGNVTGNISGGTVAGSTGTFSGAVSGTTGTFTGDVDIADKIVHTGDTDTAIRFPSNNIITAETGGSERLRIDTSGRVLIGTTTEGHYDAEDLTIASTGGYTGITLRSDTDQGGAIYFSDATSGAGEYDGQILYSQNSQKMVFAAAGANRLELSDGVSKFAGGKILLGTSTEGHSDADDLTLQSASGYTGITLRAGTTDGGAIYFSDATSGDGEYKGQVLYSHNSDKMFIVAGGQTGLEVHSDRNVEITDGNLVIGTSGHGIDFSATSDGNGTDSSELFDDYEEGSFTPSYPSGSGGSNMLNNAVYSNTQGYYTKIGGCVTFSLRIQCSSHTVIGGHVKINGLPYASGTNNGKEGGVFFNYSQAVDTSNGGNRPTMHIGNSSTTISFYNSNGDPFYAGAGGTNWNLTLHLTGVYHTF